MEVARIDGALPLLSRTEAMLLARISLRRLWNHHVSAYPFENLGPDHDPGLDAAELVRSYHVAERDAFISWIARRAAPPLAHAAATVLAAKGAPEVFARSYAIADSAAERLDALLPTEDPLAALVEFVRQLSVGRQNRMQWRAVLPVSRATINCIQPVPQPLAKHLTVRKTASPAWRSPRSLRLALIRSATPCAHRANGRPA
ncbi:hypothetical protein [Sphingomonas sp. IC081]|uniref:hypothetical protein n=1 Tax=Sphingomonas sp. IC081 TaxID=304378 RepID=UPI00163CF6E9|nr:hypothetical protein [Sphingomonas sp. IC081]